MNESNSLLRKYNGSQTLFIVFGDARKIIIKKKNTYDFYEFFDKNQIDTNILYLNDQSARWYLGGIPYHTKNVPETVEFLKNEIKECGATKVYTMGGSYGGYGAILYGILLNVDKVIAFNPQLDLNIDSDKRITPLNLMSAPPHWILGFYMLNMLHQDKKEYFNLIEWISNTDIQIDLHYGTKFKMTWFPAYYYDMKYLNHLKRLNLSHVSISEYEEYDHGSHHGIKESGELLKIINNLIL